jgi:hypothetical protein
VSSPQSRTGLNQRLLCQGMLSAILAFVSRPWAATYRPLTPMDVRYCRGRLLLSWLLTIALAVTGAPQVVGRWTLTLLHVPNIL